MQNYVFIVAFSESLAIQRTVQFFAKASPSGGSCHRRGLMRGCLPGVFPSSGAHARHLPPKGEGFFGGVGSPVAAIPVTRYNGQTPRDATMRPLQTCRKRRTITVYCNSQNSPPGRGGALPRPRPNGNCDITGKRHGGVGSPRPTSHCLKICPHCGHTLSKL